jgi:hypothetical protein
MRGISRYIECNNLILLIIFLKFEGVMTFITIKDQEAIATVCSLRYRPIKVL